MRYCVLKDTVMIKGSAGYFAADIVHYKIRPCMHWCNFIKEIHFL